MTLNGAIMQLVEMRENSMMPEVFKPYFDKVIETISECEEPSTMSERKKGKWISFGKVCNCSVCYKGYDNKDGFIEEWNYCPNCGADMRGEKE